jgi:CRP-like cAMP-binding protein
VSERRPIASTHAARPAAHLLAAVPIAQRREGEAALERCRTCSLPAGTGIVQSSAGEGALLYVDEGLVVARIASSPTSRSIISCESIAGDLVVAPEGHDQVVHALRDSRVTLIPTEALHRLVAVPAFASLIVTGLEQAARQAHATMRTLAHTRQTDRVRVKLLQLAQDHGRVSRDGIRLDFPLTHEILAEMVGAARETVTRALDELEREGFLIRDGRIFCLLVEASAVA